MKKRLSVAGLGIRLTVRNALLAIIIVSALQVWLFLRTEHMWTNAENSWNSYAFEWILDEEHIGYTGKIGFIWLLAGILSPCTSGRNQVRYTLRRLRISENELTVIWAFVFAGYFLISWAVQLGLVLWMFNQYAQVTGWGEMDLIVAAYRSNYFHMLLPLSEPWGYVRNIVLCLSWGAMGSLLARYMRHGGKAFMAIALIVVSALAMPAEVATMGLDILWSIFLVAVILIQIYLIREVERNED